MAKSTNKPKISEENIKKVCEIIKGGNYMETAASYVGIAKSTLYDWMKNGARCRERLENGERLNTLEKLYAQFSSELEKSLAEAEVRDVLTIGKAAQDNWTAAAWRLERRNHERWGKKETIKADVNHDGKVKIELSIPDREEE
jgi:transposase